MGDIISVASKSDGINNNLLFMILSQILHIDIPIHYFVKVGGTVT